MMVRTTRSPVSVKKAISITNAFVLALVCCAVLFPSELSAQRAAVGIGSKLKNRFGGHSVKAPPSGKNTQKTVQGEQEYDNNGTDQMPLLLALHTIATEKLGITAAMVSFLCGYIYLFLHQRRKVDKIEQAIAGGEFRILAYHNVAERKQKMRQQNTALYSVCLSDENYSTVVHKFVLCSRRRLDFSSFHCVRTIFVSFRGKNYRPGRIYQGDGKNGPRIWGV